MGKTGRLVVAELLAAGHRVRAIVRPVTTLSPELPDQSRMHLQRADLSEMPDAALGRAVGGRGATVACLGHVIRFRG
jgi:nucleoside-diphosphate-sugar epimerase